MSWAWRRARRTALTQSLPTITEFSEHFDGRRGPSSKHFEQLLAEGLAAVELVDGCFATLERARASGLKLALLSNLATPYKQPVFELGLDRHFDELLFSCDVGMAKPDPAIFEHTAARLGLAPAELIMIGDSRHDDVRGARSAGMQAIHFDSRGRGDIRQLAELLEHPLLR